VRIIAGKYKGHKLVSFDEDHIRPTTDRVKESLFNIISARMDGPRVLDLYSGTGSLGLEAFSRGAGSVDMVEISRRSIEIIKKNLRNLRVSEGVVIHKSDAVEFVKKYEGDPFDLVLVDPPFPSKICLATLEALEANRHVMAPSTLIVIEHSRHEPLPDSVGTLRRVDSRSYGDKLLAFYER
jgi:16S rRNA (guanine966-N2)-methyltransferase